MTTQVPALCLSCTHRHPAAGADGTPVFARCAAFPDVIPVGIRLGDDHRTPRGDEAAGITYQQADGQRAADMHEAWRAFSQALPQQASS